MFMAKNMHKEEAWVKNLCNKIENQEKFKDWKEENQIVIADNVSLIHSVDLNNLLVCPDDNFKKGERLILNYDDIKMNDLNDYTEKWNVDIFVGSKNGNKVTPRLIIEAKYRNINTHDPITYNHKALLHKNLFKGLRYGLIVGDYKFNRKEENVYIPSRLVKYGDNFDFMMLLKEEYNTEEINQLIDIIIKNVEISKKLENLNRDKENRYQCIVKNIEFY
jgi:hypothetical protein